MYALYRAVRLGKVSKTTPLMPSTGAVQVTRAGLSCLHVEGGSRPWASALWLVTASAFISALSAGFFGLGLGVMVGMARPWCEPEPDSPAQVPRPARTRISAARTAIHRGWRYQRGPRGRPGGG